MRLLRHRFARSGGDKGAKTALLAFSDGDARTALRSGANKSDRVGAEALVRMAHPGYDIAAIDDGTLWESIYPPDDIT